MSEAPNERETVRRHAYHALRVLEIVQETPDTRTFVMDVPDAIGEFYRYRPGQFCTVRVHLDGTDSSAATPCRARRRPTIASR